MAVRVKIEMIIKGKGVESIALANSGYESDLPEVLFPLDLAKRLGLKGSKKLTYLTAGGETRLEMLGFVDVRAITEDKSKGPVKARLMASPNVDEVIINDQLIGELEIDLVNVKEGRWRFIDDPPTKLRSSEPKRIYI